MSTTTTTTTTTPRPTTTTTTTKKPIAKRRPEPEIEWWGNEGMTRGGGRGAGRDKVVEKEEEPTDEEDEQEQADSVYRGGMWLEGVSSSSNRHASYPPKVERTDDISASARIPDIVSGVVMNYSFIQVGFCLVFSQVL